MKQNDLFRSFNEITKNKKPTKNQKPFKWPREWTTIYYKSYPRFDEYFFPKLKPQKVLLSSVLEHTGKFGKHELKEKDLAKILKFGCGVNTKKRYYPSAGARYPLEIYFLSFKSEMPKGLYHYNVLDNSLEYLRDFQMDEINAGIASGETRNVNGVIVISAIFHRNTMKYGNRGYRYVLQECGHIMQNILLLCKAQKINSRILDSFVEAPLEKFLDIDGMEESVISMITIEA